MGEFIILTEGNISRFLFLIFAGSKGKEAMGRFHTFIPATQELKSSMAQATRSRCFLMVLQQFSNYF
jgi:hypothetical protein